MTTYTVNNTEQEKKIYCGREYEHNLTTNTQYNYIYVGNTPIALYVQEDTNAMYTLHTNYIGSIEKITNTAGEIVDSMSYTPFGQRRMFSDWSKTDTATHLIDRGFTGQQHLDNFALINFNGRMYDPVLAHFLSPDPYIQSPENPLNYNRYSYCLFSPLQYVDPSGFKFGDYFDLNGNYLGWDGENDGKIYFIKDKASISYNENGIINNSSVNIFVSTSKQVVFNILRVYFMTIDEGDNREFATCMERDKGLLFSHTFRGEKSVEELQDGEYPSVSIINYKNMEACIHSHPGKYAKWSALVPSDDDNRIHADLNVITGRTDFVDRTQGMGVSIYGAVFYDKNWKQLFSIEIEKLKQVFINTH